MNKSTIISISIAVVAFALAIFNYINKPKMGYVINAKILVEYNGVKEGKNIYEEKATAYKANIGTLQQEFEEAVSQYQAEYKTLSKQEQMQREQVLVRQEGDVKNYIQNIEQKIQEEDQKLSQQVLSQIDSYILEYGKKHDYDYIFGSSEQNNLFYAKDADDLTEEILKGLNETYNGNLGE